MIIDSHVHLVGEGWIDRSFFIGMARVATIPVGRATGEYPDPGTLVDNLMPVLSDTTGEKTVAAMDAAGVDKACIFAVDYGLLAGEPAVSIEDQNRMIAEAARRFPDRLIPFFTVDPRRPGALDLFRRGVEEWGMKGLKLHPTSGYFPHDPVVYPFYEKCVEYGIPVLFHTGSQPAPMKFRFAQPIHVDDVAADFPDLPIIMAHVAHQLWEEALMVAGIKTNVYFDFSGWQIIFNSHPEKFYRMLRTVLDEIGPWRVFFGTDGPYLNVLCPWDRWVKAVTEPDLSPCPEVSFTPEEIDIIMGRAFARLLKLE
ncbi:amidohydrolase family protein [Candidatus Solincola tengchongensis]|uniref:amidohydrolase family protein n=1 Tax=Candidatus Solincola tengchongensis TaxID=2900693 RepID=UPI00257B75E1|nr:amidohydrolase family protein [Candidatus Solincola tengchongensis]